MVLVASLRVAVCGEMIICRVILTGFVLNLSWTVLRVASSLRAGLRRLAVSAAGGHLHVSVYTGCECQGTIICCDGNIPLTIRSMKDVPSSLFTNKSGATSNHRRICKSPRQRC